MATIISGDSGGTAVTTATQKILQVVQSVKTDTASVSGGTFADIGLSASITPSSSSNKILIYVQANTGGSVGYSMKTRLMRDSTAIHIGDAAGNRPRATTENTGSYSTGTASWNNIPVNIVFLDSPSTTSAVTYKLQYASYVTYVAYINRSGSDSDTTTYDARTSSSIILMEVES